MIRTAHYTDDELTALLRPDLYRQARADRREDEETARRLARIEPGSALNYGQSLAIGLARDEYQHRTGRWPEEERWPSCT